MSAKANGTCILAVDLGGTKVAVAAISPQGELLLRAEEPTCQDGPQAGIGQIVRLLRELLRRMGVSSRETLGVGVGIPAVLGEDDQVLWAPNLQGWRDVALRPSLEQELGLPTVVEYDGHTAVLGEWWQGAGRGYRSVAMVIVGTGLGGGLILDGHLYRGRDRLAGAAGWFVLTTDTDRISQQGKALGHWESLAAGPGFASHTQDLLVAHPESSLYGHKPLTAKEIFEHARAGDSFSMERVAELAGLLGLGVANIVSLINPEIVILGGSIGRQGDLLAGRIGKVVTECAQPVAARSVVITSSQLGKDAGLYGAAYAVLARMGSSEHPERRVVGT